MSLSPLSQMEHHSTPLPTIRSVTPLACLGWLRLGWADLAATWHVSLFYGLIFAGLGWLLVNLGWSDYHWVLTLTSGVHLVAPILAAFLYPAPASGENLWSS